MTAITKCREWAISIGKEAKDNRWPPGIWNNGELGAIAGPGFRGHKTSLRTIARTVTALFVAKREIEIDPDKRESARVRVTQKVVDQRRRVRKGRPHPRKPIMRRRHTDRGDNPDPGIQL